MKRLLIAISIAVVLNVVFLPHDLMLTLAAPVDVQAMQSQGPPQWRPYPVSNPVSIGMVVMGFDCTPAAAIRCVAPRTPGVGAIQTAISGVVVDVDAANSSAYVIMMQQAVVQVSNLPSQGDVIVGDPASPGMGLDSGVKTRSTLCNTISVFGNVTEVVSATPPYAARVTVLAPGSHGELVCSGTVAAAAISNAALANSSVTINSTACILGGGCTIPVGTGTVTAVTASTPLSSTGGATPAISCASCLTSVPSTLVNASCTVTYTAAIANLTVGPRPLTSANCTGVVLGGLYAVVESAASMTAGPSYSLFGTAVGTATGVLTMQVYAPAMALGASFTKTFAVYRLQ